jgi:hypothetical protein
MQKATLDAMSICSIKPSLCWGQSVYAMTHDDFLAPAKGEYGATDFLLCHAKNTTLNGVLCDVFSQTKKTPSRNAAVHAPQEVLCSTPLSPVVTNSVHARYSFGHCFGFVPRHRPPRRTYGTVHGTVPPGMCDKRRVCKVHHLCMIAGKV